MAQSGKHDGDHHGHHIVPLKSYHLTIGALLVLTVLTVAVSYVNFGSTAANLAVAMAIASLKAGLVLAIFMGLRWDSNTNRISMVGSIAALAVFVWLVAADKWYRINEPPLQVKKAAATIGMEDIQKWEADGSDAVIAKGKEVYTLNCAACHGGNGLGDGPAGAALKPAPRNFASPVAEWKNGASTKAIYVTLAEGIPGGAMAGFAAISPQDRWALVHFIRSIAKEKPATAKGDARYAEVLEKVDGVGANAVAKQSIPIDLAIERILEEKK